jgi:hypothetical protein
VIYVERGKRWDYVHPAPDLSREAELIYPIKCGTLLVFQYGRSPLAVKTLSLVTLPTYKQQRGIEIDPQQGETPSMEVAFTEGHRAFVYLVRGGLVCRDTRTLEVVWSRPVEESSTLRGLTPSAGGRHIVAAFAGVDDRGRPKRYISIWEVRGGDEVNRLPLDGTEGMALSSDGRAIAIMCREPGKEREILPTIHIHDTRSGRRLTSVIHDRIKPGRQQLLEGGCRVWFTTDGERLITSAKTTKVWAITYSE